MIFGIFVSIYTKVCTGKSNMEILKFLLISCLFCWNPIRQHPTIAPTEERMEQERYICAVEGKNEICNFCVEIKYLLNFKAFKFCINKVPENFQELIVSLSDYFNAVLSCMCFFKHLPTAKKVNIFLDNPEELCLVGVKWNGGYYFL